VANGSQECVDANEDAQGNKGKQTDGEEKNINDLRGATGDCQHGGLSLSAARTLAKHHQQRLRRGRKAHPKVRKIAVSRATFPRGAFRSFRSFRALFFRRRTRSCLRWDKLLSCVRTSMTREKAIKNFFSIATLLIVLAGAPGLAATNLAPAPPMGWNSWDSYGLTITEAEFKANVTWFHQHLQPLGWQYVVVDEGWYLQHPGQKGAAQGFVMDADGRYLVANNRFSSSGFKPLADWVHSLGLKFGIHIIRGIPREAVEKNLPISGSSLHAADAANTADTCRWNSDNYGLKNNAAAQAYYDSIIKLYAGWGVDYIKVDCISKPYQADEIHMVSAAIAKSGRPMVLSLSPGPTPIEQADDLKKYAQLWRISDDMWDTWSAPEGQTFPAGLVHQFDRTAQWAPHIEAGHWPDADMLPLGYLGPRPGWKEPRMSRLTADESRTLMTLWSMARSPLVAGTNLTKMDPATEALYTNPEVIAVDQHSRENREFSRQGAVVVWKATPEAGGGQYVAVFNLGDAVQEVNYPWKDLGLPEGTHGVRDLWVRKELGKAASLKTSLRAHASVLYRVR
jgi:alpha-galactosidase